MLQAGALQAVLGAVLLQNGQPVAYASKALTQIQSNKYSQIEKKRLAVLGCKKIHQYNKTFNVLSDHKTLEIITWKLLDVAPPCL